MKILIIGGTGNISTTITKQLLALGHDLTLFRRNPQSLDWLQKVRVLTGDRKCYAAFEDRMAQLGTFDCVIDMICFDPEDAESDIRTFAGKTRQFVLCSTVDVYPKRPECYPLTEETKLSARPSFPYAFKKVQCEQLCWAAHKRGEFALTVLRPAFTYNESWSPGIHAFGGQTYHLDRLRKGQPIILHGDGSSIWMATHRDDTASAFIGAIGNESAFGGAYNVTGDEWMTHEHIWRTIARVMRAPEPDFVCIPTDLLAKLAPEEAEWCRENFRYNNIFDNSKAKRDLGFRYTVRFEEGTRRCIEWLTAHDRIEDSAKHPFYDRIVETWRRHEAMMEMEFRGQQR